MSSIITFTAVTKIVQKLFNTRLEAFKKTHEILNSSQYGFWSNMSTSLVLLEKLGKLHQS